MEIQNKRTINVTVIIPLQKNRFAGLWLHLKSWICDNNNSYLYFEYLKYNILNSILAK